MYTEVRSLQHGPDPTFSVTMTDDHANTSVCGDDGGRGGHGDRGGVRGDTTRRRQSGPGRQGCTPAGRRAGRRAGLDTGRRTLALPEHYNHGDGDDDDGHGGDDGVLSKNKRRIHSDHF